MNQNCEQVLESSRYLRQESEDGPRGCVCCGDTYPGAGSHCNRCQAPLELSHSVRGRGAATRFVTVLGASGAGKTVFLGTLMDMLSKGCRGMQGIANGAFSVAVQEQTMSALENRLFPDKTASEADGWQWVHCDVTWTKKPNSQFDLITPDFAGEAISLEIERPSSYPAIRAVVSQSKGILLLCDSLRSRNSPFSEDIFAMKLASYIYSTQPAQAGSRRQRHTKLPVAIVFTKCDRCPEAREDPERFAANNLPRLLQFCKQSFAEHRFFAASVVGSCGTLMDDMGRRSHIAFHIEPRGITEPLLWIMNHH